MYNKATPKRSKSHGGGGCGFFARFARKKKKPIPPPPCSFAYYRLVQRWHKTPARPARWLGVGRSLARFSRHERPSTKPPCSRLPPKGAPPKASPFLLLRFLARPYPMRQEPSAHVARDIDSPKK